MQFFSSLSDFTPDAITAALSPKYPGVNVSAVNIVSTHQGSASHVKLDLLYDANPGSVLPTRMFVKTSIDAMRAALPSGYAENLKGDLGAALYVGEVRAFDEVVPGTGVEAPTVYASALGDRPDLFYLFMDDLVAEGAFCPTVTHPLTVDQVAKLIVELAKLHATYWESRRMEADGDLAWTALANKGPSKDFLRENDGPTLFDIEFAVPFKAGILKSAGLDVPALQKAFFLRQRALKKMPQTIVHGDAHPGNIYVKADGSVGLIDWQLVRKAPWTHDISYLIAGALSTEERRKFERDLLGGYRQNLIDLGLAHPPSPDELWEGQRNCPAWGLTMWGITPVVFYSEDEMGASMNRFAAAWRDYDTSGLLGV
jgi:Phosphotransferase enzyme family